MVQPSFYFNELYAFMIKERELGRWKEDRCTSNGTLTPKSAPLMGP